MQKLARIEPSSKLEPVLVQTLARSVLLLISISCRARPNIQAMESRCVLLKNMFNPEEYAVLLISMIGLTVLFTGRRTRIGTRSSPMM